MKLVYVSPSSSTWLTQNSEKLLSLMQEKCSILSDPYTATNDSDQTTIDLVTLGHVVIIVSDILPFCNYKQIREIQVSLSRFIPCYLLIESSGEFYFHEIFDIDKTGIVKTMDTYTFNPSTCKLNFLEWLKMSTTLQNSGSFLQSGFSSGKNADLRDIALVNLDSHNFGRTNKILCWGYVVYDGPGTVTVIVIETNMSSQVTVGQIMSVERAFIVGFYRQPIPDNQSISQL